MFNQILNRLPRRDQIVPVYAVIAFMMFSWMIAISLWKIPSWLYFQTFPEILAILAYAYAEIFVESLLILGVLLAICFLLPPKFLKDDFALRGIWTAFTVIGTMFLYVDLLFQTSLPIGAWLIGALLLASLLSFASARIGWLAKAVLQIADRLIIFLYILIPVSLVSLLTVLILNIK